MATKRKKYGELSGKRLKIGTAAEKLLVVYNESELFNDITFVVGEDELGANRTVVGSSSDYFRRLLFGHFRERNENRFVIKNVNSRIFKYLLRYCYFQEVDLRGLPSENIRDLAIAAHRFQLNDLAIAIEQYLFKNFAKLDVAGSLIDWLEEAEQNDLFHLKNKCVKWLGKNFEDTKVQNSLYKAPASILVQILSSDSTNVSHKNVIKFSIEWHRRNSDHDFSIIKQALNLEKVDNVTFLLNEVEESGLFSSQEIVAAAKAISRRENLEASVCYKPDYTLNENEWSLIENSAIKHEKSSKMRFPFTITCPAIPEADPDSTSLIFQLQKPYLLKHIRIKFNSNQRFRAFSTRFYSSTSQKENWLFLGLGKQNNQEMELRLQHSYAMRFIKVSLDVYSLDRDEISWEFPVITIHQIKFTC